MISRTWLLGTSVVWAFAMLLLFVIISDRWQSSSSSSGSNSSSNLQHQIERLTELVKIQQNSLDELTALQKQAATSKSKQDDDSSTVVDNEEELFCPDCVKVDSGTTKFPRPIYIHSVGTHYLAERYSSWPVPVCDVECYVRPQDKIESEFPLDGMILGSRKFDPAPNSKSNNKTIYIFHHLESNLNHHPLYQEYYERVESIFDITSSFHFESDSIIQRFRKEGKQWIHLSHNYAPWEFADQYYNYPVKSFEERNTDVISTFFVSSCHMMDRLAVIDALLKRFEGRIHSFGGCRKNKEEWEIQGCAKGVWRYDRKVCVLSQYKFHFAFDNQREPGYVTEKFFHALQSGAVPVYWGAPNIKYFDPMYGRTGHPSYIDVNDFESIDKLSDYLEFVANNRTEWMKYQQWRSLPPTKHWKKLISRSWESTTSLCQICKAVGQLKSQKNLW